MGQVAGVSKKGEVLQGQEFEVSAPSVMPYTEQEMAAVDAALLIGTAGVDVTPINKDVSKVRTYGLAAVQALLDATVLSLGTYANLPAFPPVLTGIAVTYTEATGDGSSNHPASQQGFITNGAGGGSISPRANATGSAAIAFDIQPIFKTYPSDGITAQEYSFYMDESFTIADILAKLSSAAPFVGASVLAYPQFRPESIVFTLKGGSVSVSAEASGNLQASQSSSGESVAWDYGAGSSRQVEIVNKTVVISPTLHGIIPLSITARSKTATALAVIGLTTTPGGAGGFAAGGGQSATINAEISPTATTATSPAAIPSSGYYLVPPIEVLPYGFDRVRVRAVVVNFAQFA